MAWSYPIDCTTPAQRIEYGYRAQEILRLIHNVMGAWYREGVTQTLYNKLPIKIQMRYPYSSQLTIEQWRDFQRIFEAITDKVVGAITTQRELLKTSTTWSINIGDFM